MKEKWGECHIRRVYSNVNEVRLIELRYRRGDGVGGNPRRASEIGT